MMGFIITKRLNFDILLVMSINFILELNTKKVSFWLCK